jgi:ABC-type phosphate/phosphonate transport system substrate-binding protein
VREGRADVCAIDCVCVALAKRYRPDVLAGLVPVARSPSVPGLPFITRAGDPARLRQGLSQAFADPALAPARDALLLSGFSVLDQASYGRITALEDAMEKAGGLSLI